MKKTIRIAVVIFLLIAFATVIIVSSNSRNYKRESPPLTPDTTSLEVAVPVLADIASRTSFSEELTVNGFLEARHRSMISSEAGGRVEKWELEVGAKAQAGVVILQLDRTIPELQAQQASAALDAARVATEKQRRDDERLTGLYEKGDLSANELEAANLALKGAEAELAGAEAAFGMAQRNLDETSVRMPFDGRLSAKLVNVGQSLLPGTPVAEVVQVSWLKLNVGVSENDIPRLRVGARARVMTNSIPDMAFEGRVSAVGAAADRITRLFPVEITVPNPTDKLLPGMSAHARIEIARYDAAIVVPRRAVTMSDSGATLFVAQDGRAEQRTVEIGALDDSHVMITAGVEAGDTVIVVGQQALKKGGRIALTLEEAD